MASGRGEVMSSNALLRKGDREKKLGLSPKLRTHRAMFRTPSKFLCVYICVFCHDVHVDDLLAKTEGNIETVLFWNASIKLFHSRHTPAPIIFIIYHYYLSLISYCFLLS